MKKTFGIMVLMLATVAVLAQKKPNYNINYSAEQIRGRMEQPKVIFFEGVLAGRSVDFSVAVVDNNRGINLTFANTSVSTAEANSLGGFKVRNSYGETILSSGFIEKRGPGSYYMNIANLPKGNYILSIDNINAGQTIRIQNY